MTIEIVVLIVIAAFILGTLEGHNLWTWLKSWFVKEVAAVETHITHPPGATGA